MKCVLKYFGEFCWLICLSLLLPVRSVMLWLVVLGGILINEVNNKFNQLINLTVPSDVFAWRQNLQRRREGDLAVAPW